jgi:hypothetical protein
VGAGTGRNLHYLRAQLDLFQRIVVLDICPELLEIGQENARVSFTPEQCAKLHFVCLDINSPDVHSVFASHLNNDISRGFDTISFSYSLSMIPEWERHYYQHVLMKVPIPHYVMCCRKPPLPHQMDIVNPHNKI